MSVDVDAVNERLNGLVTLLKAVGVDSDDIAASGKKSGSGSGGGLPDVAKQLNDDQIEAIIKKLQQAQAEAPQIIAALEAHAEARSLTGGEASSGKAMSKKPEKKEEVVVVEEEEEEDDDEFDEDANYPMVGHGVSDDISVVSDLTTPTVVPGKVADEEHYRETLPPMIVGGVGQPSMVISTPKRKNLVNQVRPPGALAPPGSRRGAAPRGGMMAQSAPAGGAAAARRKMYQDTMARIGENPSATGFGSGGMKGPPHAKPAAKSHSKHSRTSVEKPKKKPTKKTVSSGSSTGKTASSSSDGWNSFDQPAPSKKKAGGPTVIDDDGFLVGDSFDPFSTSNNPFKSSAGDLEFGKSGKMRSDGSTGFASFDGGSTSGKSRKSKTKKSDGEKKSRPPTSKGAAPRRSRRASAI